MAVDYKESIKSVSLKCSGFGLHQNKLDIDYDMKLDNLAKYTVHTSSIIR